MHGETHLNTLLRQLAPRLHPETFVFCTVPEATYGALMHTQPFASIRELEGLTLILRQDKADEATLSYNGTFRCITLSVHSSLEAVGLTAAISTQLAQHQISANMLAGFHHDHVFIPAHQAESAMQILTSLTR